MIRLIHSVLILLFSSLLVTIFHNLMHLNFISHASRALGDMMRMIVLALMNVILATPGTSVTVNTSDPLV